MSELRVCVVSGFAYTDGERSGLPALHADAYVYEAGGRNVAYFHASRTPRRAADYPSLTDELRGRVAAEAETWIAAQDAA